MLSILQPFICIDNNNYFWREKNENQ